MTQDPIERQRIAELAFELWCQRGRPIGSPEVDWERAEELFSHDTGVRLALRPSDPVLDGNGYERHATVSHSQATDPAPKVFVQ